MSHSSKLLSFLILLTRVMSKASEKGAYPSVMPGPTATVHVLS